MNQAPTVKSELNKLRHNQQFLAIAILFFATALVWVAFGLFSSQQSTRITTAQKTHAQPLSPTLDTEILQSLENKTYFSESELESFVIYQLVALEDSVFERAVPIGTDLSTLDGSDESVSTTGSSRQENQLGNEVDTATESATQTSTSSASTTPIQPASESGALSAP